MKINSGYKKLNLAVPKEKRRLILSFNRWRNCIAASFGYDPLKCPHCGETMALMDLSHMNYTSSPK